MIICKPIDVNGTVLKQGFDEKIGYEYYDVITPGSTLDKPNFIYNLDVIRPLNKFDYVVENNVTKFKVNYGDTISFAFDFRDWKYLSNFRRFSKVITDPMIIAGLQQGSIEIDFGQVIVTDSVQPTINDNDYKVQLTDQQLGSKFEIGGRLYFETAIFAPNYISFSTNGFFDRQGYVEPIT